MRYVVIPLNPLVHPVNVLVVTPVYVIISSSIFKRPYSCGNPLVLGETVIVSVVESIPDATVATPATTSFVKLSILIYLSIFSPISREPP